MGTTRAEPVPEPKYWHVKTVLSEALESEFAVGQVLPNERDLAARYGVARATLRQALEQLELEGRLQRRRGVGTTVAPPRMGVEVTPGPDGWPGLAGDAWHVEDCAWQTAPAAVSRLLEAQESASVHVLRRVRTESGQPVATEVLYVPGSVTGEVPATGAARGHAVLRALHRGKPQAQERSVELGSVPADDARRLDRLPGAPVLVVTTRYLSDARTVAVAVATYRADTCRLTFGDRGPVDLLAS
ncbi:GntR family transcriptional regulator [Streptomyces sp. JJ66]|uniref:GntR family transcriptional regulator n=1 Tax=Streptomyces sp. JJ66 TaxID=2803843 RepID=UPI001C5987EC|nr:GntR family transcriptional regulator [Streptomyces sp. JJ66]MBW1603312.1 GntR family transcriptional regulator [Streptomyces sp. JJ66]